MSHDSSYQSIIESLKYLSDWNPPNDVMYDRGVYRNHIAVIAKALIYLIENNISHKKVKGEDNNE